MLTRSSERIFNPMRYSGNIFKCCQYQSNSKRRAIREQWGIIPIVQQGIPNNGEDNRELSTNFPSVNQIK